MQLHLTANLFQSGRSTLALLTGLRPQCSGWNSWVLPGPLSVHMVSYHSSIYSELLYTVSASQERERGGCQDSFNLCSELERWDLCSNLVSKGESPTQIQDGGQQALPLDGRGNMQEQGSEELWVVIFTDSLFYFPSLPHFLYSLLVFPGVMPQINYLY